ncbi:hypothetical protein [Allocoleopsis franciscana]|uniref:Glycosyltransferase n=1 Tax=Allocoleopsis franciscana PCC 7113 TaxID=1173027 RepID=K9WLL8_9CYAN|nr:hypothetical protein [Allocoleopsis franciscana]AFZ20701.1 hypothetical protein Mic7113_5043 [Allocoleopsis franciscana PCC 7113]
MKFAVLIVSLPDYVHSEAFREIGETIHYALLEMGHDSLLTSQINIPARQHIILGSNLLPFCNIKIPVNSIIYNLEQVSPDSPWFQPNILDILRQYVVWDYSQSNIEQLARLGITSVQHVPIGYVPQLSRIPKAEEDIDVLFYGSVNERRLSILQELKAHGVKVHALFGVYGAERDSIIGRSKIVLNIHFYEAKVFEIVRVSYLLANQRFVISERGINAREEAGFASGVVFADYDDLVTTCLDFLSRNEDRTSIAEAGFNLMSQRIETDYLKTVIEA